MIIVRGFKKTFQHAPTPCMHQLQSWCQEQAMSRTSCLTKQFASQFRTWDALVPVSKGMKINVIKKFNSFSWHDQHLNKSAVKMLWYGLWLKLAEQVTIAVSHDWWFGVDTKELATSTCCNAPLFRGQIRWVTYTSQVPLARKISVSVTRSLNWRAWGARDTYGDRPILLCG